MKELFHKPLSFKNVDPKNIFVWSDLHLGHDKEFLWKPRGFNSVEEHDLAIKQRWQSNLNDESIIFILGDIMFGHNAEQRLLQFFNEVLFKICFLMAGNHSAGYKQLIQQSDDNLQLHGFQPLENEKYVQFIPNYIEAYVGGLFYVMSHYPILSANGQSKYNYGGHCHGHCHMNLYKNDYAKEIYKGKVIDVGVENVPEPLSFDKLNKMFDKRENLSYDHHNNETNSPV